MNNEAFVLIPERMEIPKLDELAEFETTKDLVARVRLFCPYGAYTCYILEYDPDSRIAYGVATMYGDFWEFGNLDIKNLESVELSPGVKAIERDLSFKQTTLGCIDELSSLWE